MKNTLNSSRESVNQIERKFSLDIKLLLNKTRQREHQIIKLLYLTGITPNELVNLKKEDLQAQTHTLKIRKESTKNNIERKVILTRTHTKELLNHLERKNSGDYFFNSRQSNKLTTRRIEQILQKTCNEIGIKKITPRDLRKEYQIQAVKTAKTTNELRQLTGLKSINNRKILTKEEQKKITSQENEQAKYASQKQKKVNSLEQKQKTKNNLTKHNKRLNKKLNQITLRDKTLVQTILETALTLPEILDLKVFQTRTQSIKIEKKGTSRTFRINKELLTKLKKLTENKTINDYLFTSRQEKTLSIRQAENIIRETGKKLGIKKLTANILRATAINNIATEKGEEQARNQAGLKTELEYTHAIIKRRRGGNK